MKDFLVNAAAEFSRIEGQIQMEQVCFSGEWDVVSFQQPLIRGSGGIILANELVGNPLFAAEFENGLKEVDIQAPILVNILQQGKLLITFQPVIADEVTDN